MRSSPLSRSADDGFRPSVYYNPLSLLKGGEDAIVNPVNLFGTSGAGVALRFKQAFPEMQRVYKRHCKGEGGFLRAGTCLAFSTRGPTVVYLPTKYHWKNRSELSLIEQGLECLVSAGFKTVGMPKIGAGLGQLDWETEVEPLVRRILVDRGISVSVYVGYIPDQTPVDAYDPPLTYTVLHPGKESP